MFNIHESNNKLEVLDYLYLAFLVVLLFNSISILPKNINNKLFLYQAISFIIIIYSFIRLKNFQIPKSIVLIYSAIFVQSIVVVLIGRAKLLTVTKEVFQLVILVIFSIVLYNYLLKKKDQFLKFINIAMWFWLISALIIIASFYLFNSRFGIFLDSYFPYPRLMGLNADPNVLGIYILTFLPLALYYNRKNSTAKIFLIVTALFVIYLTYSRSNTILACAFVVAYFLFGVITKNVSKKEILGVVIIMLIIAGIMLMIPAARQATEVRTQQFVVENTVQSDSRFGLWAKGLKLLLTYPTLGVGLDHSILYIGKYIHNTFLEILLSCGVIVGGAVTLFYFVNPLRHLIKAIKSELNFYMCFSYIGHIITIAFVSLINFEPTFILFTLSAVILNNHNNGGSLNFHESKKTLFLGKRILVFPSVHWSHNWERQHELIYRLAKNTEGEIYIFPPIGYINYNLKNLIKKVTDRLKSDKVNNEVESKNPTLSNMRFVNLPIIIPYHNIGIIRNINKALIKPVLRELGISKEDKNETMIFATYSTDTILDLIEYLNPKMVVLDIAQRRKANPNIPQYAIKFEEELIKRSNVVFADSQATCEDYKEIGHINYFCQGVSLERNTVKPAQVDEMDKLIGPIVGYIGALHSSIDYELVEFIIKDNPSYNFVFVGNVIDNSVEKLKSYPNALFVGRKNFNDLNNYIQYFEVGIVPYLVNSYTEGVSPTKLFEYGIQHKPVVATCLREVVQFGDTVYLGQNKEEFSKQLRHVIEMDNNHKEIAENKIYELSVNNSWESKFNFFYNKIIDTIKSKNFL